LVEVECCMRGGSSCGWLMAQLHCIAAWLHISCMY